MKQSIRLGVIGLVTVLSVFMGMATSVSAQSALTDDQLKRVSENCISIKSTLNQLHATDALLRVNRGQLYEAVGAKLMNNFNTRLTNNNQDAKGLVLVASSYQTALATFRSDYQSYERQLSAALNIECASKPLDMHLAIESAREKRAIVHTDIIKLNQFIDDYRSGVNDFLINFNRTTGNN